MIFDSNVVIHLFEGSASGKFGENVAGLMAGGPAFINEIVFAEVSGRFPSSDVAMTRIERLGLRLRRLTPEDCHLAGVAFLAYRRAGGPRESILPDFLIGAQAERQGWPIVTRDRKGFAKHFPAINLIDPYEGTP